VADSERCISIEFAFFRSASGANASGGAVQPIMHRLSDFERGMMRFRHADNSPGFWIAPGPSLTRLHDECAKAPQLNPISPGQGGSNFVENGVDDPIHVVGE